MMITKMTIISRRQDLRTRPKMRETMDPRALRNGAKKLQSKLPRTP